MDGLQDCTSPSNCRGSSVPLVQKITIKFGPKNHKFNQQDHFHRLLPTSPQAKTLALSSTFLFGHKPSVYPGIQIQEATQHEKSTYIFTNIDLKGALRNIHTDRRNQPSLSSLSSSSSSSSSNLLVCMHSNVRVHLGTR